MANVNKYSMAEIDFDSVREKLREFLKSTDEFSDYNFEGSGLSVLLNALAYNTSYNLVYQNFAVNESFLDTAVKKSSVISHANTLNYVPRSYRAPCAVVTITVQGSVSTPTILNINAFSPFTTSVDGVNYTFYTLEDYTATKDASNYYIFEGVELYEGSVGRAGGTYNNDEYQCFRLEDAQIDTTTIRVTVDEQGDGVNTFTQTTVISGIDGDSKVYFLTELPTETYKIEFGDGNIGHALKYGDIVSILYLSTNGDVCNGAKSFSYSGVLDSHFTIISIVCTQAATGGAESEDIESIRRNAPKMYATQERCVTANDYKATILAEYPNLKGVAVWGGQDMNPPQYGKVFISAIKDTGTTLTDDEKNYIVNNILSSRKTLTSIIEFSDPEYIKVGINCTVYYDSNKTTLTADDIKSEVISTITDYLDEKIGSFDMDLKYSQFLHAIDEADESITNNITSLTLVMEKNPVYDVPTDYSIDFGNPIKKSSASEENVISTGFTCSEYDGTCYIDDDPTVSKLRIFHYNDSGEKVVDAYVGTVDYSSGLVSLDTITITSLATSVFEFVVNPANGDVYSDENQFATLDTQRLAVTVIAN